VTASCAAGDDSSAATSTTSSTRALTRRECIQLVRRTYFNLSFSKDSPLDSKLITSCTLGESFFKRSYYDCVFATKYSNTLDCAYAAKGIDRSKSDPLPAGRKAGEEGFFGGSIKGMDAVVYRGQDPRTTIDHYSVDRYLGERDNIDRSFGEKPPADHNAPLRRSASHVVEKGQTYWVAREDFTELQLVKIRREETKGSGTVLCVQFGNSRRLRIDQGYCAAMIKKYFHVALAD